MAAFEKLYRAFQSGVRKGVCLHLAFISVGMDADTALVALFKTPERF